MINPELAEQELQQYELERIDLHKNSWKTYLSMVLLPIISLIGLSSLGATGGGLVVPTAIAAVISAVQYYARIKEPFHKIKTNVRTALLAEFMKTYHPDIKYRFHADKKDVKTIIKGSGLISPDYFHEEDVIQGSLKDANFYLSEIKLENKSGKTRVTIFKGMLFKIQIAGKKFPRAQVQSKPGALKKFFSGFVENVDYNFWYDTNDEEVFCNELEPLFPFIQHLIGSHQDIRIKTMNDTITIMIKSDMKFLDDPKPSLEKSFFNQIYYDRMGTQLNSLLYIIEAFVYGLDNTEIEERLELKALEFARNYEERESIN